MQLITTRIFTATALVIALSGCGRDEPTSYLIPKEERSVAMPGATPAPASQAPSASAGNMQVLPGMQQAADAAGEISYTVPEGWEELAPSGIRKANLKVTDANGSAELTVLVFPGDVGGRLANINRWRGQIGLPAAGPDELPDFTEGYTISQHRGLYVRMQGETQSILGGLLPFHGYTWFFKFLGDNDTVMANEAQMKTFLDSVQLQDTHH
ncbi:hypothetical protein QEH59_13170 [Coraliomargarita sp. SDUM461004]|uniref:Lipoprotein n=1 Tax=Thalassobacterium sedimentorum TaxID=3041258 RepID=A0ABU1ANN7_9BACT|nr:hypothetical protein [Coraliomargarita sp. SDUM461004]MDQ8195381.1 hypothetical protein [Coraliomargarita sp. SDUM461004]